MRQERKNKKPVSKDEDAIGFKSRHKENLKVVSAEVSMDWLIQ